LCRSAKLEIKFNEDQELPPENQQHFAPSLPPLRREHNGPLGSKKCLGPSTRHRHSALVHVDLNPVSSQVPDTQFPSDGIAAISLALGSEQIASLYVAKF
jgi:hypothetical protein